MPTGIALPNPAATLYAAADRILLRDGAEALTSRAVTDESGVSKGVLHRHFPNFDAFLVGLVSNAVNGVDRVGDDLVDAVGQRTVVSNLADMLSAALTPITLGIVRLVISRDALRAALRPTTPRGIPVLTQATAHILRYLIAERELGRIRASADVEALALTLIGTGHLLFAGELGALPDRSAVDEVVESIMVGALTAR